MVRRTVMGLVIALAAGCASQQGTGSGEGASSGTNGSAAKPAEKPAEKKPEDSGYYAEEMRDGRWYVFGREATHRAFVEKGIQPVMARTDIGGGMGGATIVYEIWDKVPEMTNRLEARFSVAHARSR